MLDQLSGPERCAEIKDWNCGGAVYLEYLCISNRLQELEVSPLLQRLHTSQDSDDGTL